MCIFDSCAHYLAIDINEVVRIANKIYKPYIRVQHEWHNNSIMHQQQYCRIRLNNKQLVWLQTQFNAIHLNNN